MALDFLFLGIVFVITFSIVVIFGMRQIYELGINKGMTNFNFITSMMLGLFIMIVLTVLLVIGLYKSDLGIVVAAASINMGLIILMGYIVYHLRTK